MAHYAILDSNNIVVAIIVGKDENELVDGNFIDWESYYGGKRTSFNTYGNVHLLGGVPFRKNFAGIGYTYDFSIDAFVPPKPFNSWILNQETATWHSPIPKPEEGEFYWNEETLTWIENQ